MTRAKTTSGGFCITRKKKHSKRNQTKPNQTNPNKTLPLHKKRSHHHPAKVCSMQILPLSVFGTSPYTIQRVVFAFCESHSIGGRFCIECVYVSPYVGSTQHSVTHPANTPLTSLFCANRKISIWTIINLYASNNIRSFQLRVV